MISTSKKLIRLLPDVVQRINQPSSQENHQIQQNAISTHIQMSGRETEPTSAAQRKIQEIRNSSGKSLNPNLQRKMEGAFGADFSHVRVHEDSNADISCKEISAKAYTSGNHIVARKSENIQNNPELLAHELTHTIQQGASPQIQRKSQKISERKPITVQNAVQKINYSTGCYCR